MGLRDRVEQALKDNPKLRDSDLALLGYIWQQEGLKLTDEQKRVFMTLTTAESITRARRALREQYPGSEQVEKERYNKFEEYIDEYSGRTAMRFVQRGSK